MLPPLFILLHVCVKSVWSRRLSLRASVPCAGSLRTAAEITGAGLCLSCSALCPLGVHKAKDHSTATQRPPHNTHKLPSRRACRAALVRALECVMGVRDNHIRSSKLDLGCFHVVLVLNR